MSITRRYLLAILLACAPGASALSLAPEEFAASRQMACVLARQSLGQLSDEEYGAMTHSLLDGFDEQERDSILAKALGYYDGLMFEVDDSNDAVNLRLQDFLASNTCGSDYRSVTVSL
ncbi:MAG: hypothetical protein CME59_12820 [Halioglobus sp.]|nr:hypothetical protein [Halioglobus sp.]|tara:strand:+ start:2709 stop:3062 length:354 start_codon:yes stop_codon:yes gene_type:complete